MANLEVVTKNEFLKKSWERPTNYLFASKDAACLLGPAELPSAMMTIPLAFLSVDGEYFIAGLQGLENGSNSYVNNDGQWLLNNFLPAVYRSYPFKIAQSPDSKESLFLSIDTDSGLLRNDDSAEPFYGEDEEFTATMKVVLETLSVAATGQKAADLICKALLKHKLFKSWDIAYDLGDGPKATNGLFCIDEPAFNELSDKAFLELREVGAMPVIYCQLLSMSNTDKLIEFSSEIVNLNLSAGPDEPSLIQLTDGGNVSFDML